MNIINKFKIYLALFVILIFQLQLQNLKADEKDLIDNEELPAIDPFAGGVGTSNQAVTDTNQVSENSGLLNNMRLVGTIVGENKKIAIFSSPDGGASKFSENEAITDSTMLIDVFSEAVIVQDSSGNEFEVYMNNTIKSSDG
jgi:hypothetical protein